MCITIYLCLSIGCLQHGITCIGFRDEAEKERFCHQLERVARWLEERAGRQKEKVLDPRGKQKRDKEETDGPSATQHDQ